MPDLVPVDHQPEFDHSLQPVEYDPFAAEKFANPYVKHVIDSAAQLVATPGKVMQVNPYPQGSEQFYSFEDSRQQAMQDWAPQMATSMIAPGVAGAEPSAVGVFGGRLAQTADHAALAKAEKMAAEGTPRDAIHAETGWFQGADGKWRFEIPDNTSRVSDRVADEFNKRFVGDQVPVQNADRFLNHPELFQAYPDLWRVNTRLEKGGGYPYQPSANYSVRESGAENIGVNAGSLGQANSMALHELQHAIQSREGFAKGADATAVGPDEYNRTAGEVEAYNVQRRKDMTPEERRATPPWVTEDIPTGQQIVNLDYPGQQSATQLIPVDHQPEF